MLEYADDTIIMVEGSDADILSLKFPIICFQQMLGLTINFHKSEVMVMGYDETMHQSIADRLNCRLGTSYLGTPLVILDSRCRIFVCPSPRFNIELSLAM